jgi:hypothetical protein
MWRRGQGQIFPRRGFSRQLAGLPPPVSLALRLLSQGGMQRSNAATKEAAMAKINFVKMCWTVMALGAFVFLTHSAFLAFAR